jgi:hypothetical protein
MLEDYSNTLGLRRVVTDCLPALHLYAFSDGGQLIFTMHLYGLRTVVVIGVCHASNIVLVGVHRLMS